MSKPQFSFLANNHSPEDEPGGVATWKMGELSVRQYCVNFRQAHNIDALLAVAYAAGRADAAAELKHALRVTLERFPE